MNNITLGKNKIISIGNILSELLYDANVINNSELRIKVDDDSFKKIDEDLFYRNEEQHNKDFYPSENEITIKFSNLLIIIEKK